MIMILLKPFRLYINFGYIKITWRIRQSTWDVGIINDTHTHLYDISKSGNIILGPSYQSNKGSFGKLVIMIILIPNLIKMFV